MAAALVKQPAERAGALHGARSLERAKRPAASAAAPLLQRWSVIATCCCALVVPATAYPYKWVDPPAASMRDPPECTQHPDEPYGSHYDVVAAEDTESSFVITQGSEPVIDTFCPGQQYGIQLSFDVPRHALLTSTLGVFGSNTPTHANTALFWYKPADSLAFNCENRVVLKVPQAQLVDTLTIPCDATGDVLVMATSARSKTDSLQLTFLSYTVDTSCAVASCVGGSDPPATPVSQPPPPVPRPPHPSPPPPPRPPLSPSPSPAFSPPSPAPPSPPSFFVDDDDDDPYAFDVQFFAAELADVAAAPLLSHGNAASVVPGKMALTWLLGVAAAAVGLALGVGAVDV